MICRCFGLRLDLSAARAALETVAGAPDYDRYVAHAARTHPGEEILTREAFFRARQAARFGAGGGLRCC